MDEERQYKPGDTVDGAYVLESLLGRGGMGVVYSCTHTALNQRYAIKLLAGEGLSDEGWQRFQIEAKALARLKHPGIVSIYNMGIDRGAVPYYVMDLLPGENLEDLIRRRGPLRTEMVLDFFIEIADALATAHGQEIIHRDIKPSNMMLVRDSRDKVSGIKLVDFGIARLSRQGFGAQSQTTTGTIFGTPYYMSPEQCQGLKVDHRSDIYSFGCALFEALTGAPPFRGENAFQTFMMHQSKEPPRLASRVPGTNFSQSLELAVAKMLAKDPADRYQKMEQIRHDLDRIKGGKDIAEISLAQSSPSLSTSAQYKLSGRSAELEKTLEAHKGITRGDDSEDDDGRVLSREAKPLLFGGIAVVIVLAIVGTAMTFFLTPKSKSLDPMTKKAEPLAGILDPITPEDDMIAAGFSPREIAFAKEYNRDFSDYTDNQKSAGRTFKKFMEGEIEARHFLRNKMGTALNFPASVIVGEISVNNAKPVPAFGNIPITPNADVCFYLNMCGRDLSDVLKLFHPDDLTGVELVLNKPDTAIADARKFTRLKHLAFFDSLTKPEPGYESYDQSLMNDANLAEIDKISGLESLGLCGKDITAAGILKMRLMRKISTLQLKSIRPIHKVLEALPQYPNIRELFLNKSGLIDGDLEPLTKMTNLESVRITRNLITPKSVAYFKRMPKLKKLQFDRHWTDAEIDEFRAALPGVDLQFEPLLDPTYWRSFPTQKPWVI